ncbi:hypothetical protein HHI36_010547 [Cryptolaemus montrouzieri]|uniref:Reverse transcriptase domain-containing protein n=1 Tax=Cryptolaemus montrouzieri TaxID=559131 RepID=A0ABD2MJ73_9CUCU
MDYLLINVSAGDMSLFADDTTFLNKSISQAERWFTANRLKLNIDKTQILISTKTPNENEDPIRLNKTKLWGSSVDAERICLQQKKAIRAMAGANLNESF